jgi:hypothetical protein
VLCHSELDCRSHQECPPDAARPLEINYLAKDYASFRQLMLDLLSVLTPQWKERNAADLGIALIELLAYVGDHLSYQQDAVATEAYLRTARKRVSVRRHVRLVDYRMHDGANSRTWVQVALRRDAPNVELKPIDLSVPASAPTQFLTRVTDQSIVLRTGTAEYERALLSKPVVFEVLQALTLYPEHNRMPFYTWTSRECCLPKGATRATLRGAYPNLRPGQVLVLYEELGPETGVSEDANPAHRHPVMLTRVEVTTDPLGETIDPFSPPVPSPVTEIEWSADDALRFPICISSARYDDVSVALGNMVLADHGATMAEPLGEVPAANPVLTQRGAGAGEPCTEREIFQLPPRFRPRLKQGPLAQRNWPEGYQPASAQAAVRNDPRNALPEITLTQAGVAGNWTPKRDLLSSSATATEFVVEVESDGTASIRFGDDILGQRPPSGAGFVARYRTGNGIAGNIGAGTLAHIASDDPAIVSDLADPIIERIWNPLPAVSGLDAETIEEARQNAPGAFRVPERAVTPDDYAEVARRSEPQVQRAAATLRWTGSWRTIFLTVDRVGGRDIGSDFETQLRERLERYRMAGHDLEVDAPHFVSLEIDLRICLTPGYSASDVKTALFEVFSNRLLPNGIRGLFHPDNFTFGQTVFLSRIQAAAQSVPGVASVVVSKFQRQGLDSEKGRDEGKLTLERLEIARLDNDPNFPERGIFRVFVEGEP